MMASYDFSGTPQWGSLYSLGVPSQNLLPHVSHTAQPVQSSWDHSSPYRLTVKQQPERAKAANAKDKDRKPVDPPPILQLDVDPSQDPLQMYITSPYLFVQTFLIGASDSDPEPDLNALTGNTCTSGHVVKDDRGVHNMMFCLNDISVKKEGSYRLKFCLFKLNTSTGDVENLTSICSQPFTTYSGRHFPGMSESTSMTRLLVDAGVRLRLRKESKAMSTKKKNNAFAQMMTRRGQDDDDDDGRPVKRMRSEPGDKDSITYSKHGSYSTPHSYTTHSTPSTSMAHFPGSYHAATAAVVTTASPSQSMAAIGSLPAYGSGLQQLGLDTQIAGAHHHYHSPPSAASSYQSPGRQSPSSAAVAGSYPLHHHSATAAPSQSLVSTGTTSPLAQFGGGGGGGGGQPHHSVVLPPVDMSGGGGGGGPSHGSSSPDLNYTTSANYNGGYMPSGGRTLPGMQQHQQHHQQHQHQQHQQHQQHRSSSVAGILPTMRMGGAAPGLQPNGHGGYGEGAMFEPYSYAPRDGH